MLTHGEHPCIQQYMPHTTKGYSYIFEDSHRLSRVFQDTILDNLLSPIDAGDKRQASSLLIHAQR